MTKYSWGMKTAQWRAVQPEDAGYDIACTIDEVQKISIERAILAMALEKARRGN